MGTSRKDTPEVSLAETQDPRPEGRHGLHRPEPNRLRRFLDSRPDGRAVRSVPAARRQGPGSMSICMRNSWLLPRPTHLHPPARPTQRSADVRRRRCTSPPGPMPCLLRTGGLDALDHVPGRRDDEAWRLNRSLARFERPTRHSGPRIEVLASAFRYCMFHQ